MSPKCIGNDRSYAVHFAVQVLRWVAAADDESARQGEEGRNDALHFFPCHFFTLWRSEVLVRQRNGNAAKRKDAMDKTSNRAGATPLFRLSAAQKVRGVAPALGRLVACARFAAQGCGKQFVMQAALHLESEKEERTWHY
jgi:hypothetical protein